MNRVECKSAILILEELAGKMIMLDDVYIIDNEIKRIKGILRHLEERDPKTKETCKL